MSEKILILGSDRRMKYAGNRLADFGFEIFYDFSDISSADILLLPVPLSDSDGRVSGTDIELSRLADKLKKGMKIYGGMVSSEFSDCCEKSGIRLVDYMKCSELIRKNAALTAAGIISEAEKAGAVLQGSSALVIGYGYCGKAIARALMEKEAVCHVMVRSREAYLEAERDGFLPVYMFDMYDAPESISAKSFRYVFNTVPAMVLDDKAVSGLSPRVMIFDIASRPGGTDFSYCKSHGIYASLSLGIPGRHFPQEAGNIIADIILHDNGISTVTD